MTAFLIGLALGAAGLATLLAFLWWVLVADIYWYLRARLPAPFRPSRWTAFAVACHEATATFIGRGGKY